MGEYIGVVGLTIDHAALSAASGGTFTVTSTPSITVKAGGVFVYRSTLTFTWAGGDYAGGVTATAVGGGTITVTATKVKADGLFVIREGDTGTMSGTYTLAGSPVVPLTPFSGASVEITAAGQTKVRAA